MHTENQTSPGTFDETRTDDYAYSNAGGVTAIVHKQAGAVVSAQCFGYDRLQRLVDAYTNTSGVCGTPATPTAGPDPYRTAWSYDQVGNRTGQTRFGLGGAADTVTTYAHPPAGGVRPHAISAATTTGPGAGTDAYGYDAVGDTTSRDVAGTSQALTWDPEAHLASHTVDAQTTGYLYDAGGYRLLRRDPDGTTTAYLGAQELTKNPAGVLAGTRYYGATASRTQSGLTWLASDHHGTAQIAIDATTLAATTRQSMPFGEDRGTPPIWVNDKGFVGGTADPTGLTHLGAREYDPDIGRFISVDPLMDLTDPQQWNGYSYANNNPTTLSDPSGLEPGSWCDRWYCGVVNAQSQTSHPMETGHVNGVARTKAAPKIDSKLYASAYTKHVGENCPASHGDKDMCSPHDDVAMAVWKDAFDLHQWTSGHGLPYVPTLVCVVCGQKTEQEDRAFNWIAEQLGIKDAVDCVNGSMTACGWTALNIGGGVLGRALKTVDNVADLARSLDNFCSFAADTKVVMADGSTKPIDEIKVGAEVLATDPETGRTAAKKVTLLWVHNDTVVDLDVDGQLITTTEDHPFWNATDQQWQQAQALDPGDKLLSVGGATVPISGIRWITAHVEPAFNLTVSDIHTYYVLAGNTPVLVHNCPPGAGASSNALSPNQMNQAILRGSAPSGIKRVDTGKVPGEQTHVHFENGAALNKDGTWKHGFTNVTNTQRKWLESNGWVVPRG